MHELATPLATILAALFSGPLALAIADRWRKRPAAKARRADELERREQALYSRQEQQIKQLEERVDELVDELAVERRERRRLERVVGELAEVNERLQARLVRTQPGGS